MIRVFTGQLVRTLRMHIALVAVCILFLLVPPGVHAQTYNQAGLIIDYGDDRISWVWVPFAEEVTVYDLLQQSDLDIVTLGFSGMGEAVCEIENTGCSVDDCRSRLCQTSSASPFWRFLRLTDGKWSMMGTGVSGAKVQDGQIYALAWSSTTPDLPIVTMDELADHAGANRDVSMPMAATHTDGEQHGDEATPRSWLPVAGSLSVVVLAAGVLVMRTRAVREQTP